MTYKQIETLREIRLWTRDIIWPAAIGLIALANKNELKDLFKNIKRNKFRIIK